jgi:predicted DNA-binding protein with PD1-like motif
VSKLIFSIICLGVASITNAQQTRTEIIKSTSVFDDSKMNNDSIPAVYALKGKFEHVLILRFKYQTDLLAGLDSMVQQLPICNAVILGGIGSVRNSCFHVVSNRNFPSQNTYVQDPTAPADILNMNGYIINGRVHAHLTLGNADRALGGHLEAGTTVFTFAIVTLGILSDTMDLSRLDDKTFH